MKAVFGTRSLVALLDYCCTWNYLALTPLFTMHVWRFIIIY